MMQPVGIILAGGQATRMGGGDKGLLPLGTTTILDHVIGRIEPQVAGLAINANGTSDRFERFGLPVVPDSIDGFAGPLAGVLAGLDWAKDQKATHMVSVAADTPFFPCDLVPQLIQGANKEGLALASTSGGHHPTFGIWPVALRYDLRAALDAGVRKVMQWTQTHNAGTVMFPDDRAFFNVNTPEDLQVAEDMV